MAKRGRKPTAKAKKAYYSRVVKGFKATAPQVAKHEPGVFTAVMNSASRKLGRKKR